MLQFFRKPYRWAVVYALILTISATFILLDTFVIPRAIAAAPSAGDASSDGAAVKTNTAQADGEPAMQTGAEITDTSYKDDNISISIETVRKYDTMMYVADIQVSDVSYLKTALANGQFGRNIKDTTSDMAEENKAIFAINGDYYGFRDDGFVIRNGVLYRDTVSDSTQEDLVVGSAGGFSIIREGETDAQTLADGGTWQVLSFGPALIDNGELAVTADSEVGKAMKSNPRTAIAQVSPLHYIVIVSDGRTEESTGLSLQQLAGELHDRGCTVAYNLDGGGSSTMWFLSRVINNPTDGHSTSERSVSDIVYFGY